MRTETCGYQGHVCGLKPVQFISRYRNANDYCINGKRVVLHDDGTFERGTTQDRESVQLFLLAEYSDYLRWRASMRQKFGEMPAIQPFQG